MPGTTRYSATFDRPYEEEDEEDLPAVPPLTRRSRSASWQATTANGRPYTPLGGSRGCHARSASTDNGPQTSSSSTSPAHSTERIPTRTTGNVSLKTSHNPFQFVKVGTSSLYRKAEDQLKKTQKVKQQPEALKEEEEEWQSNLDSWKSRRRKMSQDVFRRQEEMKELLEMEVQQPVAQQKKVKTFSEMVEERANKGRTLSLCLYSNPLGLDDWGTKDGIKDDSEMSCNDTHQSSESEESSNVNSEDENDVFQSNQMNERNGLKNVNNTQRTRRTGAVHFLGNLNGVNNGISLSTQDNGSNCDCKVSNLTLNGETLSHKCEPCQSGAYNDSGLDSLSSSHRAGDIPDSGSDFSQDSGSSLDCDSPGITGIPTSGTELLEEFSSKDVHPSNGMSSHKEKIAGMELCLKLTLNDSKFQQYGFTINGGKDKGSPVTVASVINGSVSDLVGLKTGDHILAINKEDISSLSHSAVISSLKQSADSKQLELLLWRPVSSNVKQEKPTLNGSSTVAAVSESPSKRSIPEQTISKEICNKTNSKASKGSTVAESSVDNRVDIVDSQSNNKKTAVIKQKDLNCKTPTPTKSQAQETIGGSASEVTKSSPEISSVTENQNGKTVESENEMFLDDLHSAPVTNNSKIPVAEKSPKIMGKRISKASQETKKSKPPVNDPSKSDGSVRKVKEDAIEDVKDKSLNIIYQSQSSVPKAELNAKEPVSANSDHTVSSSADKKVVNESSKTPAQIPTNKQEPKFNEKLTFEANEILPVDKVAEQMERLILEQLEEEERLKEKPQLPSDGSVLTTSTTIVSEHELSGIDTPPRQAEPPKEKPPPPPTSSSNTNKASPLNRVNSTKRIKKEIQKRRSDFLGIEKSEEEESTIPPPPDLENILKLECEQERKVRELLGKESLHQRESSFEEEEIARKEREIIENLETEERLRLSKQTTKDESMSSPSNDATFAQTEEERIRKLQEERVRMEEERFLKEEQEIRLEEERQLREREEQIRREEENAADSPAITSSTVLATNSENTALVSPISSSVSNDVSLSQTGDGKNKDTACMPSASGVQSNIEKEATNNLVPTKPLKKKEVIRKERERLRQEQEALQREREEYRRQMMKEQELLKESQKPHAPDVPVSRVGVPPPLKPALPLPLTSLPHASQALKENVIYTSRSPATNSVNTAAGNHNAAVTSQSPSHNPAARPKVIQNDNWGSNKVPVVKKQPDTSSESRYNQNHWLIQEAEMRRIAEQKERQRVHPSGDPRCAPTSFSQGQYHPMHRAEENYALQKPPVIPGAPSLLNKLSNYPVPTQMHTPDQQWNYGQPIHPTPQNRKFPVSNVLSPGTDKIQPSTTFSRNGRADPSMQAPTKPSRVIPVDRQEHMLSVSGRKRCSHCGEELGRGAAMIIESLQLYYHIQCFRCCVCQAQLGNGSCGTDVRVRNNKLHCHNCYSNDEAGLKFSQV